MSELLQACVNAAEAYGVVADIGRLLFPDAVAALCSQNASRTLVETQVAWGSSEPGLPVFAPDDCWALRRGRAHVSPPSDQARRCQHLLGHADPDRAHLCLPLSAQGEPLGLLHLSQVAPGDFKEATRRLAQTAGDNIALALANLRLRETLRSQSIRDALTGLYNRRYLEETLERELSRAGRAGRTLGVIMLDIDHFKRFNDTFGHAAGDVVLRELGAHLQRHVRGGDIACRLGGEEFVLIMPEAQLSVVRDRANAIQDDMRHLNLDHGGQPLGAISVSAGIAVFPEHGQNAAALMEAAETPE
jgi:diguanylate cyclase (GGDEF)-like protein